jgi:hypothetical protein
MVILTLFHHGKEKVECNVCTAEIQRTNFERTVQIDLTYEFDRLEMTAFDCACLTKFLLKISLFRSSSIKFSNF